VRGANDISISCFFLFLSAPPRFLLGGGSGATSSIFVNPEPDDDAGTVAVNSDDKLCMALFFSVFCFFYSLFFPAISLSCHFSKFVNFIFSAVNCV
jgi:hypothetical protein